MFGNKLDQSVVAGPHPAVKRAYLLDVLCHVFNFVVHAMLPVLAPGFSGELSTL
jgi:hypothetical protein